MKQLLFTAFFLACTATAFANEEHEHIVPPVVTEAKEGNAAKKTAARLKAQETTAARPAVAAKEAPARESKKSSTENLCAEGSRFGISAYFVDFVHTSNLKLVKLLL